MKALVVSIAIAWMLPGNPAAANTGSDNDGMKKFICDLVQNLHDTCSTIICRRHVKKLAPSFCDIKDK